MYQENADIHTCKKASETQSFLLQPVVFSILINHQTIKAEGKNVIDFVLP